MRLDTNQTLIIIAMLVIGTMITRFLPFIIFPAQKETPAYVRYLGKALPYAMMGLLVIYCLKGASFIQWPYALPEMIAVGTVIVLHLWKNNIFISIGLGTLTYMLLIQLVFI